MLDQDTTQEEEEKRHDEFLLSRRQSPTKGWKKKSRVNFFCRVPPDFS